MHDGAHAMHRAAQTAPDNQLKRASFARIAPHP